MIPMEVIMDVLIIMTIIYINKGIHISTTMTIMTANHVAAII